MAKAKRKSSKKAGEAAAASADVSGDAGDAGAKPGDDANSKSKTDVPKRKRDAPKREDEYVEEKQEIWKSVFLVGTEWDQLDDVYTKHKWNFDNLDAALEDGELSANDNDRGTEPVYLFGATEPQLIRVDEDESKPKLVVPVPVIVALRSSVRPPDMLGIKSVQMEHETIVPMKQFKMGWVEHVEPTQDPSKKKRHKTATRPLHVLACVQRKASIRNLKDERVKNFEYCLPYIFFPHKAENEDASADSTVNVVRTIDGKGLVFEYDWEMDELDEFTKEILESHELPPTAAEEVKTAIRDEVKAAKERIKEEKEARKKKIESFSKEECDKLKNMKMLKFYPTNKIPDISNVKSTYINRYYGHAQKIL